MRFRFRQLMVVTTGLTFVLMLLGIYTAAFGAGLTCGARWPFCDGWLGLFPANIPSFIEWFHRLIAMITGFVILGTAYAAWTRSDDRRVAWSVTLAVLLLPLQIGLGAVTVTLSGLFPWGYAPSVQILHYTVALVILALLTVGTALTVSPTTSGAGRTHRPSRSQLRRLTATVLVLLPIQYLFSYGTLFVYSANVQIIYYALSLAMFALLITTAVWTAESTGTSTSTSTSSVPASFTRLKWLSTLGTGLLAVQMLIDRQLWGTIIPPFVSDGLSLVLFVLLLVAGWVVFRDNGSMPSGAQTQNSD